MELKEALSIIYSYQKNEDHSLQEYLTCLDFVKEKTHNPIYMMDAARFFYEREMYHYSLKYYEQAAQMNFLAANIWLGNIWFYGKTGKKDYEKAYIYYMKSMKLQSCLAKYHIALMYHFGYFVDQNEQFYQMTMRYLYEKLKNSKSVIEPIPEVCVNMASIDSKNAVMYLEKAKESMYKRIQYSSLHYNIQYMKEIIQKLYKLVEVNYENLSFFDLYKVLEKDCEGTFQYKQKKYSFLCQGNCIRFNHAVYVGVDDFIFNAKLENSYLYALSIRNIKVTQV